MCIRDRTRVAFNDSSNPAGPEMKTDAGRFLAAFSYSGPAAAVRVQRDAKDGEKIYADRDFVFSNLPSPLQGSDWVQTANADKLYSAVDLLDFALSVDGVIYVAYDSRLPRPDWLQRQFNPTELSFPVNGQPMKIFVRHVRSGESVTPVSYTHLDVYKRQRLCKKA